MSCRGYQGVTAMHVRGCQLILFAFLPISRPHSAKNITVICESARIYAIEKRNIAMAPDARAKVPLIRVKTGCLTCRYVNRQ